MPVGERVDAALGGIDVIDNIKLQSALALLVICVLTALEIILSARHLLQSQIRAIENAVEIGCLDIGFQIDLSLIIEDPADCTDQNPPRIAHLQR